MAAGAKVPEAGCSGRGVVRLEAAESSVHSRLVRRLVARPSQFTRGGTQATVLPGISWQCAMVNADRQWVWLGLFVAGGER